MLSSGKSVLAKALRRLDGTLFATESILPTCLAHLVNQPIDRSVREVLERGVANHLAAYAESGEVYSRFNATMQFLRSDLSLSEFRKALTGKRIYDLFLFESNFYSFAPEFLAQAFPAAAWLFVVRDGRDCADQLERNYGILTDERLVDLSSHEMPIGRKIDHRFVPWWVNDECEQEFLRASPFGRAIWMWKATIQRTHAWISKRASAGNDHVMLIKYEELVTKPIDLGMRISSWLGKPAISVAASERDWRFQRPVASRA